MINNTVENLIKKINLYQVHQQEKEKQKSKNNKVEMTVNPKGPYFTTLEPQKKISEYKSHINNVTKSKVGKAMNGKPNE